MNRDEVRARAAELLLAELTTDAPERWYYISMAHTATNRFVGGVLLQGRGPTDAWMRFHGLNLCEKDCETLTTGPIDDEIVARIPQSLKYRKLSKEEAMSLGSLG